MLHICFTCGAFVPPREIKFWCCFSWTLLGNNWNMRLITCSLSSSFIHGNIYLYDEAPSRFTAQYEWQILDETLQQSINQYCYQLNDWNFHFSNISCCELFNVPFDIYLFADIYMCRYVTGFSWSSSALGILDWDTCNVYLNKGSPFLLYQKDLWFSLLIFSIWWQKKTIPTTVY